MPNMGGSLPLYLFADILQAPIVSVPVVNHDNGQHAANENLRIQNLWDAIETYAVLLARLEPEWRAAVGAVTKSVGRGDAPTGLRVDGDRCYRRTLGGNADFGNLATTV